MFCEIRLNQIPLFFAHIDLVLYSVECFHRTYQWWGILAQAQQYKTQRKRGDHQVQHQFYTIDMFCWIKYHFELYDKVAFDLPKHQTNFCYIISNTIHANIWLLDSSFYFICVLLLQQKIKAILFVSASSFFHESGQFRTDVWTNMFYSSRL